MRVLNTVDFKGREAGDLRQAFGELPIVEAKADTIVYVSRDEIGHSVRRDPHNCVFANACKRAFGSRAVLFYPTIAYVDMLDSEGNRVVMRFRVSSKTRAAIERFDQVGDAAEATFVLSAIPKGSTLAAEAKRYQKRMRAVKAGVHKVNPNRSRGGKKAARTRKNKELMGLRVGSPT